MNSNIRGAHIGGMWGLFCAIIALGGIYLQYYLNQRPQLAVENKKDSTSLPANMQAPIYGKTPKGKVQHHAPLIILTRDEKGNALSGVSYLVGNLTGFSDKNGQIEIDVTQLNPATEFDMFPITLKKDGYVTIVDHIGITENSTFQLHKYDKDPQ